jgi:two-component sensor histidine kinase/tetratricopeptide (TPR) repeat protein
MKKLRVSLLSFLTLVLFSFSVSSQEKLPDSIAQLLSSQKIEKKARGMLKAIEYYQQQSDSFNVSNTFKSFEELDLSNSSIESRQELVLSFDLLLKNSFQYNIAKRYLLKNIALARESRNFENAAKFHQSLVHHYFYTFDYDSTDYHINKAISLYKQLNNQQEIGELTARQAGTSYAKGNYEEAIDYVYKSIEIFKKTGNKEKLAVSYLQLGNIFYFLSDYRESMQYYELSLSAFKTNNDNEGIYRALSNIGLINLMLKNYRKCISQQLEALQYFESKNKELEKGNAYLFLSASYWGIEKYDSAKFYNELSIKSNRLTKYRIGLGEGYLMRSKIFRTENKLQKSLEAAKRAFSIADSVKQFEIIKSTAEQLSIAYDALGQIDSSYRYLKIHNNLRDSLDLDPQVLKNYAIKQQFQVEEAQFELLLAKEKAQIQEQQNSKKQTQLVTATVVAMCSILLLVLAVIILYRNKILSKQLIDKQAQISSELQIKESLLNEIHHRVKNNLQVISSMLSLQTQYISDDRVQKVISDCKSRINSMSLIHESLYKKNDGIEAPFSEYIKVLIPQLIEAYKIDESKIKAKMKLDEIHLNLDESIPCGLLINEIVSNALKHAFPNGENGEINIHLSKKEGFIRLQIADNGVGFNDETTIQKQESFGFLLIETLAKQLEADMECVNDKGIKYDIKWRCVS